MAGRGRGDGPGLPPVLADARERAAWEAGLARDPGFVAGFDPSLNLRDLGGRTTVDGRRVRRGLILRCGELARTSRSELLVLGCLGLRHVLDLRTAAEAARAPDPCLPGVAMTRVSGYLDRDGNEVDLSPGRAWRLVLRPRHRASRRTRGEGGLDALVAGVYASLAFDNRAFRTLFGMLEAGEVPLLFHCSAGKDRSGVAALLVQLALGVDPAEAVGDFARSNDYLRPEVERALAAHPLLARTRAGAFALRASEGVVEECGHRLVREMRLAHGSVEGFLEAEYGLGPARLAALRERYLEPADGGPAGAGEQGDASGAGAGRPVAGAGGVSPAA